VDQVIQARVDLFVRELLDVLDVAVAEACSTAFQTVESMIRQPPGNGAVASAPSRRVPRVPVSAAPVRPRRPSRRRQPAAALPAPTSPPAPGDRSDLESAVLASVRHLGRATAVQVAAHSGRPNGSVAKTLRALVAKRDVARTSSTRGAEYSLVSPGSVQPFKRASRTSAARAR
jgi:hypothetical protein